MHIIWALAFAAMMIYVAWWLICAIRKRIVFEVETALGVGSLWAAFATMNLAVPELLLWSSVLSLAGWTIFYLSMKRPDRVTITTFWLDWLLLPIMLGAGWLTFRWALADFDLASSLGASGTALPPWAVAVPLAVCAIGWVILGSGSLIRQEYYEHRIWVAILIVWSISCLIGAGLIGWSFLRGDSSFGLAGVLSLIGLALTALMLSLPAFMEVPLGVKAIRFSRQWTVLLVACLGCLTAGTLLGFPYNFPRFPFGIGALFFFGLGALEVTTSTPTFPWLPRLYDLEMEQETFLAGLPKSNVWRVEGAVKLGVGIGAAAVLIITAL